MIIIIRQWRSHLGLQSWGPWHQKLLQIRTQSQAERSHHQPRWTCLRDPSSSAIHSCPSLISDLFSPPIFHWACNSSLSSSFSLSQSLTHSLGNWRWWVSTGWLDLWFRWFYIGRRWEIRFPVITGSAVKNVIGRLAMWIRMPMSEILF